MASRVADLVLVLDAVNANETVVRVGVVFIQAIKPKDPRRDQILRRKRIDRQQPQPPDLFRVTGRTRTCGHRLLFFSTSP